VVNGGTITVRRGIGVESMGGACGGRVGFMGGGGRLICGRGGRLGGGRGEAEKKDGGGGWERGLVGSRGGNGAI